MRDTNANITVVIKNLNKKAKNTLLTEIKTIKPTFLPINNKNNIILEACFNQGSFNIKSTFKTIREALEGTEYEIYVATKTNPIAERFTNSSGDFKFSHVCISEDIINIDETNAERVSKYVLNSNHHNLDKLEKEFGFYANKNACILVYRDKESPNDSLKTK